MNVLDRLRPMRFVSSNGNDNRSPARYEAVLRQFNFDTSLRYQPAGGDTFCNIAAWDASRALCCEVPHWWNNLNGSYGMQELVINEGILWLGTEGVDYGWTQVDADAAKAAAALGQPTLVTWRNPTGHGHIAWVMPDWTLAQAGASCGYGISFTSVFTPAMMPQLEFWTHS